MFKKLVVKDGMTIWAYFDIITISASGLLIMRLKVWMSAVNTTLKYVFNYIDKKLLLKIKEDALKKRTLGCLAF